MVGLAYAIRGIAAWVAARQAKSVEESKALERFRQLLGTLLKDAYEQTAMKPKLSGQASTDFKRHRSKLETLLAKGISSCEDEKEIRDLTSEIKRILQPRSGITDERLD